MLLRRVVSLLGLLAVLSACNAAASGQGNDPPVTAAVGGLPAVSDTVTTDSLVDSTTTSVSATTTTVPADAQVGALVTGNRVLLIGDSVMASTSQRYGGEMCATLVPLGWQTEVDAETGRFIDFGKQVLDKRLAEGWDATVILLGNNYGEDQGVYRDYLDAMMTRLAPMPVVLLTVTEFKPSRIQVNDVVREMAAKYPSVIVLDWASVTAADPTFTGDDGLHLTDPGRSALAGLVSMVLGPAPVTPGKCLSTGFHDDSSGPVTGTTVKGTTPKTTLATGTTTPKTTVPSGGTTPKTTVATTPVTQPVTVPPTTPTPVTEPAPPPANP
jgi:hypothetical protein